jgi:hypothetical protein
MTHVDSSGCYITTSFVIYASHLVESDMYADVTTVKLRWSRMAGHDIFMGKARSAYRILKGSHLE